MQWHGINIKYKKPEKKKEKTAGAQRFARLQMAKHKAQTNAGFGRLTAATKGKLDGLEAAKKVQQAKVDRRIAKSTTSDPLRHKGGGAAGDRIRQAGDGHELYNSRGWSESTDRVLSTNLKRTMDKHGAFKPFTPPKFGPAGLKSSDPAAKLKKSQEVGSIKAFDQKKDGIKFDPPPMPKVGMPLVAPPIAAPSLTAKPGTPSLKTVGLAGTGPAAAPTGLGGVGGQVGGKVAAAKLAGSRLRSAVKLVEKEQKHPTRRDYLLQLAGETIGKIKTVPRGKSTHVSSSLIKEPYRGMGLGKKMYGELMRSQPGQELSSSGLTSPQAQGVWKSMKGKKGYSLREGEGGLSGAYSASLPAKAAKEVTKLGFFQTSQYSGPLSMGRLNYRSRGGMPSNPGGIKVSGPPSELGAKENPDTEPYEAKKNDDKVASMAGAAAFAIDAVSHWEAKEATISSPSSQLNTAQTTKAAPKMTAPSGPSIAQVSKPIGFGRPMPGATKTATLKEMVRLALKDVPHTPRMLMKKRTSGARAAIGSKVEKAYDAKVTKPLKGVAERALLSKLPEGKGKRIATKVTDALAEDPVGMTAANLVPLPGAAALYLGAKKGVSRMIDAVDPVRAAKAVA